MTDYITFVQNNIKYDLYREIKYIEKLNKYIIPYTYELYVTDIENKNVNKVVIPEKVIYNNNEYSITSISMNFYSKLKNIKKLFIPEEKLNYGEILTDNILFSYNKNARSLGVIWINPSISKIYIPNNITKIDKLFCMWRFQDIQLNNKIKHIYYKNHDIYKTKNYLYKIK